MRRQNRKPQSQSDEEDAITPKTSEEREEDENEQSVPHSHHLPGEVEQFRPHRLSASVDVPIENAEKPRSRVEEEEELILFHGLQQSHKPTSSAYALLEESDKRRPTRSTSELEETGSVSLNSGFPSSSSAVKNKSQIEKTKWRRFKKYIYNNDNNAYCNRTISNWCQICTYYFWIIILFFAVFMLFILSFVWRDHTMEPVFLKVTVMPDPSPAVAIVPLDSKQSEMILWYKSKGVNNRKAKDYIEEIYAFLANQDLMCDQKKLLQLPCHFNMSDFGPCAKRDYGYTENKPCIFLKLNKLITWMPSPIIHDNEFPDISEDIRDKIHKEPSRHAVYVDCKGKTIYDQQNLGPIEYYPEPAYDVKFFPATRETRTNPLIAIRLNKIQEGRLLHLHCTLLAGNIKDKDNSNIKLVIFVE